MIAETRIESPPASPTRQKKRGFTLTEIAIVLGIIGLILGAIWVAAAAVLQQSACSTCEYGDPANRARCSWSLCKHPIRYPAVSNAVFEDTAMCAKATPSDLTNVAPCGGTGTMVDMWSNGVTGLVRGTNGEGFGISMSNVPPDQCVNFIMGDRWSVT